MTKIEDDKNGRQPKWKTTKMEDYGRSKDMNLSAALLSVQPQLVLIEYYLLIG